MIPACDRNIFQELGSVNRDGIHLLTDELEEMPIEHRMHLQLIQLHSVRLHSLDPTPTKVLQRARPGPDEEPCGD